MPASLWCSAAAPHLPASTGRRGAPHRGPAAALATLAVMQRPPRTLGGAWRLRELAGPGPGQQLRWVLLELELQRMCGASDQHRTAPAWKHMQAGRRHSAKCCPTQVCSTRHSGVG